MSILQQEYTEREEIDGFFSGGHFGCHLKYDNFTACKNMLASTVL